MPDTDDEKTRLAAAISHTVTEQELFLQELFLQEALSLSQLAAQLVDKPDIPITDVYFAAGCFLNQAKG